MIIDSGNRTKYKSGAVRDMKKGKGRCDLLLLNVVLTFLTKYCETNADYETHNILHCLYMFQKTEDTDYLYSILGYTSEHMFSSKYTMLLELSVHFEEGAEKYGIANWKKGIPEWSYIDSAIRHLLKWARGDEDERHDRAFVWNIVCLIWTVENKGENSESNNNIDSIN